ncbi:MAG: glycosyltransferase family 39 protein [Candidatus Pacebacteria bacterium]|nr:glycosyltransferase family 39 protein [Candidatus Paceibacterota bacterium]
MFKFFSKLTPIHWLLIMILIVGAFLRLYNIPGSMMFLGDQGRDAIIVKRIFTDLDPVFIGPVTSVGNMYLGPGYYYFMLPWLWLSYPSPVGPAYAVAILGTITVFLMYYLGKELVGKKAAIIGTAFFALSSTVVNNTRFSWNPNPAPLVSLLMIFFTYQAWKKNPKYWILVSLFFSILIQLHYLTLLSATGAGIFWLISVFEKRKKIKDLKPFLISTLLAFILFISSLTPILLFDMKHDYLNAKAFSEMITGQDNFKQNVDIPLIEKATTIAKETHGRGMHILFEISIGKQRELNTLLLVFTLIIITALIINHEKFKLKDDDFQGEAVIIVYLLTGIVGTSFYGHTVFDHYIAYLFPVSFLTFGIVIAAISSKSFIAKVISMIFFFYFVLFNFNRYNLKTQSWSIFDVKRTSESILEKVREGEKYNIVLLSETGDIDGQSYRYFLETSNKPPVPTEKRGEVETLIIINEDQKIDKVTDSPIYEIVVFPNKDIKEVYNIDNGPEITILRKN